MDQITAANYAKQYLEDLLTFFEVNTTVEMSVEDTTIQLVVPATNDSSLLIGRRAETLQAFQFVVNSALRNQGAGDFHVSIDIADYKKQRAEKIAAEAREWIEEVRRTGDSHVARLNPADRRIVHQVATEYDDIETFSEGEGRDRRIVIAQRSS